MATKLFFIVFSFLLSLCAAAQKNFIVYHTTGTVLIKKGGKETAAARGSSITAADMLIVKPGASTMLLEAAGKSVQIDKAGNYSFSQLKQKLSAAKQSTVSGQFFAYVYDNLMYKKDKQQMNVTPVVYRDRPAMQLPQAYGFVTAAQPFAFQWRQTNVKAPMHFRLANLADSVIIDTVLRNTNNFQIMAPDPRLQTGQVYKWQVGEKGLPAPLSWFQFLILPEGKEKAFQPAWNAIDQSAFSTAIKNQLKSDLLFKARTEAAN